MTQGTIARLVNDKGFGFIAAPDGVRQVFFHFSVVDGGSSSFSRLHVGQLVAFEEANSSKGPRAKRVTVER